MAVVETKDIIDTDIPYTNRHNPNTFAVIIGNENYTRGVANVDYAINDAKTFSRYCVNVLGLPEKNVRLYTDATYGDLLAAIDDIKLITDSYKGEAKVIFYYAGHGVPDDATKQAYLMPIDAAGSNMQVCYPLSKLYGQLSEMNTQGVVVLLDACFSGSTRGNDMLASVRGVRIAPKHLQPKGNMVVFSASTGSQTAFPYREKGHGMFTYYLLEKLRESNGDTTIGELYEYVSDNVTRQSVVEERKPQIPTIATGDIATDSLDWTLF